MDVYFFFKQRTDLIRHFYDAASAPFLNTQQCIELQQPPFDDPPDDESGEPAYQSEWSQADLERELVGRAAVSMLSEALKDFFRLSEREARINQPCSSCFKTSFKSGFITGYVECFTQTLQLDWSTCPADLDILKQVVLARNLAQHSTLILDHLRHDEKSSQAYPNPFFVDPDRFSQNPDFYFLAPTISIHRERLFTAIEHAELLAAWLQNSIENHYAKKAAERRQRLTGL